MDKPLKDWTLREFKEYCKNTACDKCGFNYKDADPGSCWCKFGRVLPANWDLREKEESENE